MLEVKVIMSPWGNVYNQKMIGQLVIVNDGTGDKEFGNYNYILSSNTKSDPIDGRIECFRRKDGVWLLIRDILNESVLKLKST